MDCVHMSIASVLLRSFLSLDAHHVYPQSHIPTKLANAPMKYRAWKKAGYLSQSASCSGRERKSKSPTPLHPGSQMHVGVPVALLQFPAPHDLVSGAVIQASQAEDTFALALLAVLLSIAVWRVGGPS